MPKAKAKAEPKAKAKAEPKAKAKAEPKAKAKAEPKAKAKGRAKKASKEQEAILADIAVIKQEKESTFQELHAELAKQDVLHAVDDERAEAVVHR